MKGILSIGRISGIRIEIHWTFIFLIGWIVFLELKRGGDFYSVIGSILFIFVLFACVVLHELGHALTAKNFDIKTEKITLLPIGGIARLEKMPEKPMEELKVAIAGPLVNLAIVLFLLILFPITSYFQLPAEDLIAFINEGSTNSFIFNVFLANIILIVFNLIPAFPMDGGRILRALLATRIDRSKATTIAATLGQILAFFFFIAGLVYNPFLVIIALFIFLGAFGENQIEQQLSLLKGYTVKDAMLTQLTKVYETYTVRDMISILLAGTEKHFIVVDAKDNLKGVLHFKEILKRANEPDLQINEILNKEVKTVKPEDPLPNVLKLITENRDSYVPVVEKGAVLGAIDISNLSEFILLTAKVKALSA
ncbi:site-2 protease family protein [Flavobacteriaceae bacterium M23B6Z8]